MYPARKLLAGLLLSSCCALAPQAHGQMLTAINPASDRTDSRVVAYLRSLGEAAQNAVDTPVTKTIWPQDVVVFGKASYLVSGPDACPGTGHAGCIVLLPEARTIEADMHPIASDAAPFRGQLQVLIVRPATVTLRLVRNLDTGEILASR
ncbi:hypothetical protein CFR75_11135 [Komagataeibacter xylinus]|uniref:Uncharacterized protein n=1 Tax=Komagataeibacter xylinus TaxID=28448 RepID=A0A318PMU3_KOMXY|nr:hypothetical protein [Komagataeibacter xylinus]PYD56366.1 hypothetical protein CFR75_11135 [Komagataeibacter xylinus]GBQ74930.1 hypothetical protein AA15237_2004 [Komagataeibacter xylinus NBRC 15237]